MSSNKATAQTTQTTQSEARSGLTNMKTTDTDRPVQQAQEGERHGGKDSNQPRAGLTNMKTEDKEKVMHNLDK
ncbi:hypothetical protein BC832DRAFT_563512 [Gaertneriomyces semiglobifer]|nr:hypothetical protein BC832DRAFT_563512 [Gaertneriomyces semiglobifer]